MKRSLGVLALACIPLIASACGGQNRTDLAVQAAQTYWDNIGHGRMHAAYNMLTSGNRQSINQQTFTQNLYGFLEGTGGVRATVNNPKVSDDHATVHVILHSPKTTQTLKAYQHLFWENNQWRISDENGQLSTSP